MTTQRIARVLPMAAGIAALLAGLWTSLARLGFQAEGITSINHGPLMVGGFVGTVIALERAVALGKPWGYSAPALGALSALLLLFSVAFQVAAIPLFLSSLILLAMFVVFIQRGPNDFTVIMALGALVWAVGNALLLAGKLIPHVVPWWAGFLILTIAGERIELSRLSPRTKRAQRTTIALVIAYLASLSLTLWNQDLGFRASGIAVVALTVSLAHGDIARRTRKGQGVARFSAYSILSGYWWLVISGILGTVYGQTLAGLHYDAWTHAVFVGFVLVMIMAHAPIILPAVAHVAIQFTPFLYVPVVLLHLSLALRVGADLSLSYLGRKWTGLFNVVAVLLYAGTIAWSAIQARKETVANSKTTGRDA